MTRGSVFLAGMFSEQIQELQWRAVGLNAQLQGAISWQKQKILRFQLGSPGFWKDRPGRDPVKRKHMAFQQSRLR